MATYYIDPWGGDDSYTSTQAQSTSTPWKTLVNLTSSGSNLSISPGDQFLIKGTDTFNPGDVTFKKDSHKVDFSISNFIKVITNFLNSESWTLVNSTTSASSGIYVHDPALGNNREFTVPSSNTGVKIAYLTLGAGIDLTGWTDVSVIFNLRTALGSYNASNISIELCTDTTGDVSVVSLPLENNVQTYNQYARFDNSFSSTDTINSVAIYASTQLYAGDLAFVFDNLVLGGKTHPLIARGDYVKGPEGGWHSIRAVGDDHLILGAYNGDAGSSFSSSGYHRADSTISGIFIQSIPWKDLTAPYASGPSYMFMSSKAGSNSSKFNIIGGYDSTWSTVTGYTFFRYRSEGSKALYLAGCDNFTFDNLGIANGYYAMVINNCTRFELTNGVYNGSLDKAIFMGYSTTSGTSDGLFSGCTFGYNASLGLGFTGSNITMDGCYVIRNIGGGLSQTSYMTNCVIKDSKFLYNRGALYLGSAYTTQNVFVNLETGHNAAGYYPIYIQSGVYGVGRPFAFYGYTDDTTASGISYLMYISSDLINADAMYMKDLTVPSGYAANPIYVLNSSWRFPMNELIRIETVNSDTDKNFIYYRNATTESDASVVDGADTLSWKTTVQSTSIDDYRPVDFKIGMIKLPAATPKTINVRVRRSSTSVYAKLRIKHIGLDSWYPATEPASAVMSTAINTWDDLSFTVTSDVDTVAELTLSIYGANTHSVWMGQSITVT